MINKETLRKVGTLGGSIHVNPNVKRYYFGDNNPGGAFSKERLFGCHGPLLIGMPNPESREQELGLHANVSDTRQGLIKELTESDEMTREQAEQVVARMLKKGTLVEVNVEGLGKVLVWGGHSKK